jgi:hypothetical protein
VNRVHDKILAELVFAGNAALLLACPCCHSKARGREASPDARPPLRASSLPLRLG